MAVWCLAAIAQDLPVIKVTTRLVQVDVVVRDGKGPVTDLEQADFRIFDQGKPQQIALFQVNGPANRQQQAAPASNAVPAPGMFTNREAAVSGPSTVILLDGIMTSTEDQMRARQQLLKFLAGVQPADRVAIYLLSGSVQMVQPFTGDSAMLVHALEMQQWGSGYLPNKVKPDAAFVNARAVPNAELAALVKGASTTFVSSNAAPPAPQIRQECIDLVALARALARVPGRKNLFWYTDGFPLVKWSGEPQMYTDEVSQANHAFSDANIAVYPVDAHGLSAGAVVAPYEASPFAPAIGSSVPGSSMGGKGSTALRGAGEEGQDSMFYVARFTGGQVFINNNDLVAPLAKIKQDAAVTYTLGFYPDSAALDSKRHSLRVEVDRKGVDLQYRKDYSATPDAPETKIPEKAQITEAIWNPVNSTGITLTARAEKVNQPQAGMLQLTLKMDTGDLIFQPDDKGYADELAVVYDERSADGKDLGRISETLNLRYDDEQYRKAAADGIVYQRLVHPTAQAAQIRIVVYDRGSARVGSVAVNW